MGETVRPRAIFLTVGSAANCSEEHAYREQYQTLELIRETMNR